MTNNILNVKKLKINPEKEIFEKILSTKKITIERIISYGQKTPEDLWLYDKRNEWVLLLQGKATLLFENKKIVKMKQGDYILIDSRTKHKVTYTSKKPPCIWLAIYF